jgi:hypothetical protein
MTPRGCVKTEEPIGRYPRLFHLAGAGSWPAIAAHGLLPAAAIVSTSALGQVVIRDQTPLRPHILEKVLHGMTAERGSARSANGCSPGCIPSA